MTQFTPSYVLGLSFILLVAIIWAGASVLMQYIYNDLDFESPLMVTYIANSLLLFYLPAWEVQKWLGYVSESTSSAESAATETAKAAAEDGFVNHNNNYSSSSSNSSNTLEQSNKKVRLLTVEDDETVAGLEDSDFDVYTCLTGGGVAGRNSSSSKNHDSITEETGSNSDNGTTVSALHTSVAATAKDDSEFAKSNKLIIKIPAGAEGLPVSIAINNNNNSKSKSYTHMDVIKIALVVSPIWFLANCMYNYSLLLTSVSSSTIISNLAASFTLFFSWWYGLEDVSYCKVLGVFVCFIGAVTVGLQDEKGASSGNEHSIVGDLFALAGAMGYGMYTTVIRYNIPDDEGISMQLLLGYIGAVNVIIISPIVVLFFFLGMANIRAITGVIFGFIVLNGFANNVFSDYLWARAVVLTSPSVATIGMSITIPLAMMTDALLGRGSLTPVTISGAGFVVAGFLLVNVGPEQQESALQWIRTKIGGNRGRSSGIGLGIGLNSSGDNSGSSVGSSKKSEKEERDTERAGYGMRSGGYEAVITDTTEE